MHGVQLVVSDDHAGLKRAIGQVLSEACWQRCYVHFLRHALDHLARKANDECLFELHWLYDRRSADEARRDLAAWLGRWQAKYPKLCEWVESNIEETWTFYRLPRDHHKHLKSTNMLEQINQELNRRTHIIRIFPNEASCLQLIRGSGRGDPQGVDRGIPLPEHGCLTRSGQSRPATHSHGGMKILSRTGQRSPWRPLFGAAHPAAATLAVMNSSKDRQAPGTLPPSLCDFEHIVLGTKPCRCSSRAAGTAVRLVLTDSTRNASGGIARCSLPECGRCAVRNWPERRPSSR